MRRLSKQSLSSGRHRLLIAAVALLAPLLLARERFVLTVAVGESMLPTIKSGQLLIVDKHAYRTDEPQRGDVVLAHYRGDLIIKRVVGLPGEAVEVKHGTLYVADLPANEDHPIRQGPLDVGKGKLLADDFATLGDNRSIPAALAVHPLLCKTDIVGKVVFSFRSLKRN